MGKKRKSIATSLDEVDRSMYASFCSAANSLSQLYTQAMNHHKLSFHAGEKHSLEKLYQWILRQQEGGSRVATVDILNYLQHELEYCAEEPSMSPRAPPGQNPQGATMPFANSGLVVSSGSSGGTGDQQHQPPKNSNNNNNVFSNALSSPIRRSLQNYHISHNYQNGGPPRNNNNNNDSSNFLLQQQNNRDPSSNDSSMDMHSESS